jgi:hypothetical protein
MKAAAAVAGLTLALLLAPARAEQAATVPFAPLAHSAQLAVDGVRSPDTLALRIHRPADPAALTPAQLTEVAVMSAGRALPLTAQTDGSWSVPLRELGSKAPARIELVVGHDGIRELLTLQLGPEAGDKGGAAASGRFARNKQLLWWILNIVIVLIAAIAIARRRT